jgi:hypothetical protein
MTFDFRRAMKLRQDRRRKVNRWKDLYGWSDNEVRHNIKHFDTSTR